MIPTQISSSKTDESVNKTTINISTNGVINSVKTRKDLNLHILLKISPGYRDESQETYFYLSERKQSLTNKKEMQISYYIIYLNDVKYIVGKTWLMFSTSSLQHFNYDNFEKYERSLQNWFYQYDDSFEHVF